MAYMNQERKKNLVALAKPILKKHGIKATFAVRNHSTIVCTIKSGPVDFIKNMQDTCAGRGQNTEYQVKGHISVNVYWYRDHFSGKALEILTGLITALNNGNHDRSDPQTDYFDVGWYVDVNIGEWNKPYNYTG